MRGAFIKVSMFDDRLEIESPGRLPDIVTVDNICYTRFSRNSQISRVMTEFGFVRELNEGVKKIFSDMKEYKLDAPEYSDSANTVRLVLKNNIDARTTYRNKALDKASDEALNEAINEALNGDEKAVINILRTDSKVSQIEIAKRTGYSRSKVQRIMKNLTENNIVQRDGAKKNGAWRIMI